jgi:DNA-binding CsgD family transcriptional regulator
LAVLAGRPREAARIFGSVAAMCDDLGMAFEMPERATFERAIAAARVQLGDDVFERVHAGGRTLTPDVTVEEAISLVQDLVSPARPVLTAREREVLGLLAAELSDAAIADRLFLSVRTAQNHVARVFAKLDVNTRADAVAIARELGMLDAPS